MTHSIKDKIISAEQLQNIRLIHPGKKIVFCTGCFDILQSGHAVFFNQCRAFGDVLIVGVGRDSTIRALKGPGRPVNPENNRLYLVAALESVDYTVLNDDEVGDGKIDFIQLWKSFKPDIFVLNDDDSGIEPKAKLCRRLGVEMKLVSRSVPPELKPTSTTAIIEKISFRFRAPLRIDFAGGWTDVPALLDGKKGYVSNLAIKPHIELSDGVFNMAGYPRGSGISTSTAVELLKMISSKNYNTDSKTLSQLAEDLFNLENKELNWAIGRQDQYALVFGGFNCFEFGTDYARDTGVIVQQGLLEEFCQDLLLLHTGISRNAQSAVEEVYRNFQTVAGRQAINDLATCGLAFAKTLAAGNFNEAATLMSRNFDAQKKLAPASSCPELDAIYSYALSVGAAGGKICGAGGGGAFIFYCNDRKNVLKKIKEKFTGCFEIDFQIEYNNIKQLNSL